MKDYSDYEYQKTNREKRMTPKVNGFNYCYSCDRALVENGIKCHVCGYKNGKRRLKRETNA